MIVVSRDQLLPDEDSTVRRGFVEYNLSQGQGNARSPIALVLYTEGVGFSGALDGYAAFDWLTVGRLWVASPQRGLGLGTRLMQEAHDRAIALGCVGATLSTYDFQARGFYEKMGYEVFGVLPNNPVGHERYFMKKIF